MTTNTTTRGETRSPQFHAYHVVDGQKGSKSRWNRIGAYFAHDDAQGGTLVLNSLPIAFDGRIVLRTPQTDRVSE